MSALRDAAERGDLHKVKVEVEKRGRDPQERGSNGWTPLHYAASNGHLPVVKYLIENKLCDVNAKSNGGNTPLSLACQWGHSSVVKYLVESKLCNVNVKDGLGRTPLSLACRYGYYDVVRVLLDNGANPEVLYVREDGSPTYPGQTVVKVFILGNPGGGKSTLSKALPSISSGALSRLRNRLTKVSGIKQQTAGIDHQVVESEQFGLIHIYDFAGHEEFYASHDAMIDSAVTGSTGVFLILTDLQKCEKECEQSMAFWLSFVKNHVTSMETPPHVLLLGTHADKVSKQEKIRKENTIATLLRNSAFSSLDIKGYLEIDCRHAESDSMTHLREVLIGSFEVLRSTVSENFAYHCFLIFLVTRFIQSPAVQLSNVISVLGKETYRLYQHLPTDLSELDAICQSFNSHGRILYLRCAESIGKSWIIIDRQALLARINGTIFAPKGFTEHCPALASSTGVVPQSKLAAHFPEHDVALITQFLIFFEFCRQLSDPETLQHLLPPDEAASGEPFFFFPALVGENAPKGLWQASDQLSYHSGWILQCTKPENFFTPRLLQTLILRVCFALALPRSDPSVRERPSIHRQCKVWKNGVCWSMLSGADGLLEITSKHVIVLVRSLQGYEMAAVQLRSTLIRMVLDAQKEFCAGIFPSESMFHPHDATQYPLSPASGLELFNSAVIAQAVVEAEPFVVSNRDSQLEVEKLLHFEPYTYLGKGYLCKFLDSGSIGTLLVNIEDRFSGVSQLDGTTDFLRTVKLLSRQDDVTREHLRNHFDKYSIFAGRNILAETGLASSADIALTKQPLLNKDEASLCTGSSDSSLQLDAIPTMPQLLHFPGRTRTINVAREIGVQYQLVGTALLDDTRGTIVPAILESCYHNVERVNTELLRTWIQDKVIRDRSWHSLIGVLRSSGLMALADDIQEAARSPETGSSSPCELLCI